MNAAALRQNVEIKLKNYRQQSLKQAIHKQKSIQKCIARNHSSSDDYKVTYINTRFYNLILARLQN